jgi:hypothetical protein
MDSLTSAMVMSQRALAQLAKEARSALPDAPVVPYVEKVPAARTRTTVAELLHHLADTVAPRVPAGDCGP